MTTLNEFGFSIFGILDEFGRFVGTPSILDERAHRIFITVFTVTVADEIVNSAVTVSESKTEIFDSSESTDIYVSRPNFIRSDFATTSTLIQSLVKEVVPDHIKATYFLTTKTQLVSINNIQTTSVAGKLREVDLAFNVSTSVISTAISDVQYQDDIVSSDVLKSVPTIERVDILNTKDIDLRKLLMLKVISDISASYDIWKISVQSLEDYISALELMSTTRSVTEYLGLQTTISKSVSTSPLDEVGFMDFRTIVTVTALFDSLQTQAIAVRTFLLSDFLSTYHTIESLLRRVYTYLMAKVIDTYLMAKVITKKLTVILVPEEDAFFIKKGDTGPILKCKIVDQDGNEKSLPITTVTFTLRDMSKTVKFSKPGEWVGNKLEYIWESTDTANLVEGVYLGEFDCTLDDGTKITVPNDGFIKIKVVG